MSKVIGFEAVLATVAAMVEDADKDLGDDNCGADIAAAHLCGRVSGMLEVLSRLNNLQEPNRAWAAQLLAAENKEVLRRMLLLAARQEQRKAELKELLEIFGDTGRDGHGHYN